MMNMMERMKSGRAHEREIAMLLELSKQIEGRTICALDDAAAWPIQGLMRHSRPEVEKRIRDFQGEEGRRDVWRADDGRYGSGLGAAG
jgi:NADH dehydrogenase (ubiquinone) flavoprotein 1